MLLGFVALSCQSTPQPQASDSPYLATEDPIDVGDGIQLCVAVAPLDPQGIWWWIPGESGCTSRSSGPGVFHADQATVKRATAPGATSLSFRLSTHSRTRPFTDVLLVVEDGRMRALESGVLVSLRSKRDLEVPERAPAQTSR
jgi:hypothetical protein